MAQSKYSELVAMFPRRDAARKLSYELNTCGCNTRVWSNLDETVNQVTATRHEADTARRVMSVLECFGSDESADAIEAGIEEYKRSTTFQRPSMDEVERALAHARGETA